MSDVDTKVEPQVEEGVDENAGKNKEPDFMDGLNKIIEEETKADAERNAPAGEKPPKPQAAAGKEEEAATTEPDEGTGSGDGDGSQEAAGGEQAPVVDDAMLERAVKAGMSVAEVKAFGNNDALESVVAKLEAASEAAASSDKKKEGGSEQKDEFAELLASIPDLDTEEYDEGVANAIKAVKSLVVKQQETVVKQQEMISALQKEVKQSVDSQGTWVDVEVAKLGKNYIDLFGEGNAVDLPAGEQKNARAKMDRHIKFLIAEAKTEGRSLSKQAAFKAALDSAFSDKVKSLKGAAAKNAAASRSRQSVNRPRNTSGRFTSGGAVGSLEGGTAAEREADALEELKGFYSDD